MKLRCELPQQADVGGESKIHLSIHLTIYNELSPMSPNEHNIKISNESCGYHEKIR